jgi:putative endonuclease
MFTVYILKSIHNEKFYVGQTEDLEARLRLHNSIRAKWTKRFQPWEIVYTEQFKTRAKAMVREKEIKSKKNIKSFLDSLIVGL